MPGYTYDKNGKTYLQGPLTFLNEVKYPDGKKRGDKLQEFFAANGIDMDLGSGLGRDRNSFLCATTNEKGVFTGIEDVFADTDFEKREYANHGVSNYHATDVFSFDYADNIYRSKVYYYKEGEKTPRILYGDEQGNPRLSEPLDRLDLEQMKPKKPGFFYSWMHSLNSDWFKDKFDRYDREMNEYREFRTTMEVLKPQIEAENTRREAENKKKTDLILEQAREKALAKEVDDRIDSLLGPHAAGVPEFVKKSVYEEGTFTPNTLEYAPDMPFTDHEIGLVGYAMLAQNDVASMRRAYPGLSPTENVMGNYTHMTDDLFFYETARKHSDVSVGTHPYARDKARLLMFQYMDGNKEPLARALGESIKAQNRHLISQDPKHEVYHHSAQVSKEIWNLMNKDPDLVRLSGLSEEDVNEVKGMIAFSDLHNEKTDAMGKVELAVRNGTDVRPEEKEQWLDSILLGKFAEHQEEKAYSSFDAYNQPGASAVLEASMKSARALKEKEEMIRDNYTSKKLPVPEADQKERDELFFKKDAETCRMIALTENRPVSSIIRLLGADDGEKKNRNQLREAIKKTETYKKLRGMTLNQIAKEMVSPDFEKKCDAMIVEADALNRPEEQDEKDKQPEQKEVAPENENAKKEPEEEEIFAGRP